MPGHCRLDSNQMSSLGLRRSVRGCLPGCSTSAHSSLALPTEQLAVGYLAPGWHQKCFVLLTDTKVRKSLPHHLVAGFASIDFTGSPSPSESFELPVLYSSIWGDKQAVTDILSLFSTHKLSALLCAAPR